jgi:hypothetical protein
VPPAVCEPICANQVARIALLAAMPMLEDVDIAPVQRSDLSHGVVIPRGSGLGGAAGGRGRGGGVAGGLGGISADGRGGPASGGPGGGPASGHGGAPTGGRGGHLAGGSDLAPTPGKGKDKQVRVVLDDDEVSSDEDTPLQKRLRLLSDAGRSSGSAPATPSVAAAKKAAADREATNRRAAEEAAVKEVADKEAADKRAAEEAVMKEASVGVARDSSAPGQAPSSVAGAKRAAVPSGSTPPAKQPYRGVWRPRFA